MTTPGLRVERLSVRYGSRVALRDVSLSVAPGELLALAGPNGSGKTTLLKTVLGLVRPAQGRVLLGDSPIEALSIPERAKRVAWVPQSEFAHENVRLADYVLYGRHPFLAFLSPESAEDRARADRALEAVGLADRRDSGIHELSGGERQRALFARALAQTTSVLLLDEPTASLDIGHQLDLLERVRAEARASGQAVIAAMHDLNLAARYSDRVAVLHHGRLVADGPAREVLSERLLGDVWGVVADLRRDPSTALPYLVPRLRPSAGRPRATSVGPPRVHVVPGGGAAAPILQELVELGFPVTCGVAALLDSDHEVAERLGIPVAAEIPFAPLGFEALERNRSLLEEAEAVVVAPFAVGPSNVANLETLVPFAGHLPIYLVADPAIDRRDFTRGRAQQVWETLVARGAQAVASWAEARSRLTGERNGSGTAAVARAAPTAAPR